MKKKYSDIFQVIYEILCFCGTIAITFLLKEGMGYIFSFALSLFLIVYFSGNEATQKIAFAIVLMLLGYLTWSVLITFYFTNFLYDHFIKAEHSLWDFFAFFIPVALTLLTLRWGLKGRKEKPKFEIGYIFCLAIALFFLAIRQSALAGN